MSEKKTCHFFKWEIWQSEEFALEKLPVVTRTGVVFLTLLTHSLRWGKNKQIAIDLMFFIVDNFWYF